MSNGRHSYVAFYMDKWSAGTAGMPRLVESVYFQICRHVWDKARPVNRTQLNIMHADLAPGQGDDIVAALVDMGKLVVADDGSVYNQRALDEATKALDLFQKKSGGGKKGAAKVNKSADKTLPDTQPEKETRLDQSPTDVDGEATPPLSASADDAGGKPDAKQPEKPDLIDPADMQRIAEAWNEMAAQVGLPQISKMTEKRKTAMRARLKDYGLASILEAIEQVPSRSFLLGQNDRGWRADIDFLMLPNSVAKINEGTAYKGKTGGGWTDA